MRREHSTEERSLGLLTHSSKVYASSRIITRGFFRNCTLNLVIGGYEMESIQTIYDYNPAGWGTLGVVLITLVGYGLGRINLRETMRGIKMRQKRREFIRSDTIDALVEHVQKRTLAGDYTAEEAQELYRDARKLWPSKDLYPIPEMLKENIQKRLANHVNDPVPLPDRVKRVIFTGKRPVKA